MVELEKQGPQDSRAEKYVYGHLAWFLLKEMWRNNTISVPGREPAWREISRVAERRPNRQHPNPAAAQRLLSRHALEGTGAIMFKEAAGGIEIPLEIDPDVFNPELTKASRLLLSVVRLAELKDKKFLDAFAGSGLLGVYAATVDAEVIAYDTSAAAVACIKKNALINGVAGRTMVRQGDYTCLLENERFDVIAANPPLLPVGATDTQPLTSAVFDPGSHATLDFIQALPSNLAPGGRCYLLSSSTFDQDERDMYTVCGQNGLDAKLVAAAPREYEWYRIHEIALSG